MKSNSQNNILGIDPGARHIGFAVFTKNDLSYYAIKTIKRNTKRESLRKLRKILEKLIREFEITHIAVEEVFYVQQKKSFVKQVFDEIKQMISEKEKIKLYSFEPKFIRKMICGRTEVKRDAIKDNTNRVLFEYYPELERYRPFLSQSQRRYYAFLFGAVAVGLVGQWEINMSNE